MIDPTLLAELDRMAKEVRLVDANVELPSGRLWKGAYAYLLVLDATRSLMDAADEAKLILDIAMQQDGIDGESAVADGYAVLALDKPPASEAAADIHVIELNTSVCRIQVVWPENGEWRRLTTLTLVAPPVPAGNTGDAAWPELTPALSAMLAELRQYGGTELASRHINEVEPQQ